MKFANRAYLLARPAKLGAHATLHLRNQDRAEVLVFKRAATQIRVRGRAIAGRA